MCELGRSHRSSETFSLQQPTLLRRRRHRIHSQHMSACRGDFGVELTSCVDSHSCAWASTKRRGRPASGERRAGIRVRVRVGFSLERRLDLAAPSLRDLTDPVPSSRRLSPRLLWRARCRRRFWPGLGSLSHIMRRQFSGARGQNTVELSRNEAS